MTTTGNADSAGLRMHVVFVEFLDVFFIWQCMCTENDCVCFLDLFFLHKLPHESPIISVPVQ
jgi:hypothetical protein